MPAAIKHSISALILVIGLGLMSLAPYGGCACANALGPSVGPTPTATVNPVETGPWYWYKDQDRKYMGLDIYPGGANPIVLETRPESAHDGPLGVHVKLPSQAAGGWSGGNILATYPSNIDLSQIWSMTPYQVDLTNVWSTHSVYFWYRPNNLKATGIMVGIGIVSGQIQLVALSSPSFTKTPALSVGVWSRVRMPLSTFTNFALYDSAQSIQIPVQESLAVSKTHISRFAWDCNCPTGESADFDIDEIGIYP